MSVDRFLTRRKDEGPDARWTPVILIADAETLAARATANLPAYCVQPQRTKRGVGTRTDNNSMSRRTVYRPPGWEHMSFYEQERAWGGLVWNDPDDVRRRRGERGKR